MSARYRFRERWSVPGRRAAPAEVGERMAAWLLDAVSVLGPDLSWHGTDDTRRADEEVVHRKLGLEGAAGEITKARASSELALSRGPRPSGSGRLTIVRADPWALLRVDTHGGEEHWDVDAFGVTEATMQGLRAAHARTLEAEVVRGGARVDPPEPTPLTLARGDAQDLAQWRADLTALGAQTSLTAAALRIDGLPLRDLRAVFEARVTLGEILAEAGVEAWDERALEVLHALSTA